MRFSIIIMLLAAAPLALGGSVLAAEAQAGQDSATTAPTELKNQTHCPVMGGKIDSTVYTDIQGQRVYHCCPMCSAKLKADPDKYFQKAAADGVLFENIQTNCPVSGEQLDKKEVYTDFEGRRVYFCCKKCRGTFNEAPQKYLQKMDQAPEATNEEEQTEEMPMDQSDHNH